MTKTYIAVITYKQGIFVDFGSLDPLLGRSIFGVKRKAGDRYSGRSARDLPITYTSRHRSIKIRVMTPADEPYSHAYHNEGFVSLYPAWLAPAGAVPLKTIVKSNDAVISD